MKKDTEKALEILNNEKLSLVLCKREKVIKFSKDEDIVKAVIELIKSQQDFYDFSAALNLLGRAAAFLLVNLEISEVYVKNLKTTAYNILDRAEIKCIYENKKDEVSSLCKDEETFNKYEDCVLKSGSALYALQDLKRLLEL